MTAVQAGAGAVPGADLPEPRGARAAADPAPARRRCCRLAERAPRAVLWRESLTRDSSSCSRCWRCCPSGGRVRCVSNACAMALSPPQTPNCGNGVLWAGGADSAFNCTLCARATWSRHHSSQLRRHHVRGMPGADALWAELRPVPRAGGQHGVPGARVTAHRRGGPACQLPSGRARTAARRQSAQRDATSSRASRAHRRVAV